ncbi:glycoside hydrolase family 30 protein [Trichoderma longibrachiatum ATCC 18648]|uniref:Glycoside hydrolase family 30 protein n=1 Tax=Trichoderma longibrachiatum ATCC 18648 TaxID=983965 RepID=A0A2T4C0G8_TRILO|nr:glycoside hydrolase family 30 protein [Trichoderma longibrachiatum ATCC 18648]
MAALREFLIITGAAALCVAQTTITVNVGTRFQQVDGFGFSQAFGRAKEFQNANSSAQKQALDLLFSTSTGAGFSIIRNRIGSGGAGDSIEPNNPGSPSATPNYVWDNNDSGQLWFTQQAVSYGVKTIYADAWGAPGFMKTSGSDSSPGFLCGTTGHSCSSGDWRQAYANFLVQYVKYYAAAGYNITHLGFLNEPDFQTTYSQMQISSNAQEAISFIPVLSSTVKAAGLSTKLTCCDATGWTTQSTYTTNLVNAGSTQYLSVITSHSYSSDATSPLSQTSLPKWNTEGGPSTPFVQTWYGNGGTNEGFTWANKIAVAMVNAQLSAYLFWEGFEIQQSQSGSHLIDALDRQTATRAYRVATSGSLSNVIVGAFQNTDRSVVVVFTNSGTSVQSARVSFSGFSPTSAAAYVTDNSHTFSATSAGLSGGAITVSVPSKGVVTVKLT